MSSEHGGPRDQTLYNMTLNLTYALVMSSYALFAFGVTLTVVSLLPMPTELSNRLKLAMLAWIALISVALCVIPGVMQLLLTAHPGYYSLGVIAILVRFILKRNALACMLSMSYLSSTLIVNCILRYYQADIIKTVRLAIERPDFLGL